MHTKDVREAKWREVAPLLPNKALGVLLLISIGLLFWYAQGSPYDWNTGEELAVSVFGATGIFALMYVLIVVEIAALYGQCLVCGTLRRVSHVQEFFETLGEDERGDRCPGCLHEKE
jgi:hypothetical protein